MTLQRLRLIIRGAVQGVGFRPFVYALAKGNNLTGFVGNQSGGIFIEIEGAEENVQAFLRLLREDAPPLSHISEIKIEEIEVQHEREFRIVESQSGTSQNTLISPDVSICGDCLRELFSPRNRRFRHPFINCTNCGIRFTIIKDLPYDRSKTTMSIFEMCALCRAEYKDPSNRRFHAQPNACRDCGARVWFAGKNFAAENNKEIFDESAILAAQQVLSSGGIVAVKGVGGFHLTCDARSNVALRVLRSRKGRAGKPFAVMCRNLHVAESLVHINREEQKLLTGKERPIVLLRKKPATEISELVAPDNPLLGIMLPYSPLHHLLLNPSRKDYRKLDVLVMTSGNFSSQPIITDNTAALEKLSSVADAFLLHDREIYVPCDDSVIRVFENHELPIRRSRGYAPFPIELPFRVPPILAVGGELKTAFCLARDEFAFMSQHIGDMENLETLQAFEKSVEQMRKLFRIDPEIIAFDKHPNYLSARWAKDHLTRLFQPATKLLAIQHHHAHIASVMAENGLDGAERVIGFAFDGTGYGDDGAVWGGEVLLADYRGFQRAAHLRYVPLAGGDISIKKPYRMALAHLRQAGVKWNENLPCVAACPATEQRVLLRQLENNFNTIPTSSFGRLFDAVAAIAGVRQTITYEAQGAIEFEAVLDNRITDAYDFNLVDENGRLEIDCVPLIRRAALDVLNGVSIGEISAKFNNAAANLILRLALHFRSLHNLNKVALSGGCFQNTALLRASVRRLRKQDFEIFTHRRVPPNDGGLALGQAVIAGFTTVHG